MVWGLQVPCHQHARARPIGEIGVSDRKRLPKLDPTLWIGKITGPVLIVLTLAQLLTAPGLAVAEEETPMA